MHQPVGFTLLTYKKVQKINPAQQQCLEERERGDEGICPWSRENGMFSVVIYCAHMDLYNPFIRLFIC